MSSSPEFRQGLNRYEDDLDTDDTKTDPIADEEQGSSEEQGLYSAPGEEHDMDSLGRTADQPGVPGDEFEDEQDVLETLGKGDIEPDEERAP